MAGTRNGGALSSDTRPVLTNRPAAGLPPTRGGVEVPENVIATTVDSVVNWCRKYSLWPMPFATACCGIELMAVGASRFDISRFGAERVIAALEGRA